MKLFISICVFALFILNAQPGFSQKEVEISGKKYLVHKVKRKETLFSLSQQYNVSPADLKQANPTMGAGLKSGSKIYIPLKMEEAKIKAQPSFAEPVAAEPQYYYHKVMQGQTIFSISRQYGITANELISFNPDIANGLAAGKVLKIPVKRVASNNPSIQPPSMSEAAKPAGQDPRAETGFLIHPVVAGETIYSLSQKYGLTREELVRLNPSIGNGLPIGARLKIPQKNIPRALSTSDFEKHKVEKGETLFSLAARFDLQVGEIKKANPSLHSRSLETGEVILIPKQESAANAFPGEVALGYNPVFIDEERGNCDPLTGNHNRKYRVGLLLPLYLQGNEQVNSSNLNEQVLLKNIDFSQHLYASFSDSATVTSGISIDPRAEGFLEFYEGALLAVDSLKQNGMNVELYVFDSSTQSMVLALLQLDVFRELDLIIGPVYPEIQHSVAEFAAKNRIPMVSPLASNGNYEQNNPYFLKVNPTKEYQSQQTAQYIVNEFRDKNFILLPMNGNSKSAEFQLAEWSKQKLFAARQNNPGSRNLFHEYNFQRQGWQAVKPLMDETGENVFMIPSDNEAQVSVAVTNLNALAEDYNVVLIATSNLPKMKSIQTENYHHVRLRYLSPTFVDYTKPLVKRFVSQYREVYAGEPSQFSHQGYDVTYYFLSALQRYGKDFRSCLSQYPMELTQMNFYFRKVAPMGGYMNQSLFVTSYEPSYDILNLGTVVPGSK